MAGGSSGSGVAGGNDSETGQGGDGASTSFRGGGGGGAGVTGGRGGDGFSGSDHAAGGQQGVVDPNNGLNGGANGAPWSGGGGGAHGYTGATLPPAGTAAVGGKGGAGGGAAYAGGGGAGGYGAVVVGRGDLGQLATDVAGGSGGGGGEGEYAGSGGSGGAGLDLTDGTGASIEIASAVQIQGGSGGAGAGGEYAGSGGSGGAGFVLTDGTGTSIEIASTAKIQGGSGGGGGSGEYAGSQGSGGVGIVGSNLAISNAGAIAGGLAGDGGLRADAVDFTGGTNSLTITATATITGDVVARGTVNTDTQTLALSGDADASFDVSRLGAVGSSAQYQGFDTLLKVGQSRWTLTGTASATPAYTISAGALLVDGATAAASAVSVAQGATLGGGGTVAGAVDLSGALSASAVGYGAAGGTGPSYGLLKTGRLQMAATTSSLEEEIGGTAGYDRVAVTGTATLGGTLDLSSVTGSTTGASYQILTASDGLSGAFTNAAADGDDVTAGGRTFRINYTIGGVGNAGSVTLTDVTVPATLAAPTLAAGSDTGLSDSDGVTDDATPTFTGTAGAGATVTIYDGTNVIGTGTADAASGAYSVTTSGLTADAINAITAVQTVGGIDSVMSAATAVTLDTTAPTVTADAASPAAGAYTVGQTLSFALSTSEAVTVSGTPTLTLNDGGNAGYDAAASTSTRLVFTTVVAAGQTAATLAVTGVTLPDGAAIRDAAGNAADLSGAAATFAGLAVDTGAPTVSSPTVMASQGGGPVPIGIAVPADDLTAAGALAIAAGALPGDGAVTLADGTPVASGQALTAAQLAGLLFTPAGAAGGSSAFTYTVTDTAGNAAQGTATLDVSAPATPDAVSLSPQVDYDHGVFTLTGTASSASGVGSVEISAVVDGGAREVLGTATVEADGSFTFADTVGPHQQGFLVATLTDGVGVRTASADPGFSLAGGLGPKGGRGEQDSYGGEALTATALFGPNGRQSVSVATPGGTVDLQPYAAVFGHGQGDTTFVFDPGDGLGVVHGFRASGANHDVVSLKGADFGNSIAEVLRNTGDVNGSAFITDPVTGDALRLAGVSTAELKRKDFIFHA